MNWRHLLGDRLLTSLCCLSLVACATAPPESAASNSSPAQPLVQATPTRCQLVESGFGPAGQVRVRAETVATGLEVPWGMLFLPEGDLLVTERPGRLRLVQNGQLLPTPVATLDVTDSGEGGLLGIAAHPDFQQNRWFYLYYTADKNGRPVNRVERWQLARDRLSATPDRIILDNIPVALFHNGGRLRFGPDGLLYIGTGDARDPQISQDRSSLAGKILRLTPEGQIPEDNPFPGNPVFLSGIRNTQGFDWPDESRLWVTDHGPSGELGRTGGDKVSVAQAGDNLGWPILEACESEAGLVTPSLVWRRAVPPGGAAIYRGKAIPEWQGDLMIGTLGSQHLHRVRFNPENLGQVVQHEVYFQQEHGRLREVIMGPDGELYVTTSNCDGRGTCPPDGDKILRITR